MANALTPPCPSGKPEHAGTLAFRKGQWSFYRCRACGHLWTDPIPTEAELRAFYDEGYFHGNPSRRGYTDYDREKERTPTEFNWYLDHLERILPQKGRLLDIGTATGAFLLAARARGWAVCGVELSAYAASVARGRGLDVREGTLEQHADALRGADVITLWDVVEHLREPFAFFHSLHQTVAPGGLIMFATPQSDSLFARTLGRWWTLVAPPQHIHYFSMKSMRDCLQDAGFEFIDVDWRGKDFTVAYIIHFVMGWLGIEWKWMRRLATSRLLARVSLRINPRDMMIVTARARDQRT